MNSKRLRYAPAVITLAVLAFVCGLDRLAPDWILRMERITYDMRVRAARNIPSPASTNLAFVSIDESTIRAVQSGRLGYRFGLLWPRQVYGRLVEEIALQGAAIAGLDVLFGELRPDHFPLQSADNQTMESDDFFAMQLRRAGNVVLAATPDLLPPGLFATNALALGDISTEKDSDGILRRVRAYRDIRCWHPLFQQLAGDPEIGAELDRAVLLPGKIVLPQAGSTNTIEVEAGPDNTFSTADFLGEKLPPGYPARARAFENRRIWHMGVVLAAHQLKADLNRATVDPASGFILLHGGEGVERRIPIDGDGCFLVDWRLTPNDPALLRVPAEFLLWQNRQRLLGQNNGLRDDLRGRVVIVGSAAQGNDLTDRGATPLERDTLLVSKHWNVANSILTGQFIHRMSMVQNLFLIIFLGFATALLTWRLRALAATGGVILLALGYMALAAALFIHSHVWLPVVLPVGGAILLQHICLVTHRVIFEEREQRRIKSVFSKIVSPEVVDELLGSEILPLNGSRREMTVLFADIRGFTALTDRAHEEAEEQAGRQRMSAADRDGRLEESARETLETVNLYLGAVADAVKQHGGTLDKYIGDCVMAFWNAPLPSANHALDCVRAAIDAQRAVEELNQNRAAQNAEREIENAARAAKGLPARPMLAVLQIGVGINTGMVTVGLMGSSRHILNYTVFGREVNLASRLESLSGNSRIIISEATRARLESGDPALAASCGELPPAALKGIRNAVRVFEVPWRNK